MKQLRIIFLVFFSCLGAIATYASPWDKAKIHFRWENQSPPELPGMERMGRSGCHIRMNEIINTGVTRILPPRKEAISTIISSLSVRAKLDLNLEEKLGSGGFGEVYRTTDLNSGEPRAIKFNYSTNSYFINSLKREYDLLIQLDHPNIIKAYTYADDPIPAILLEYIPGVTLEVFMKNIKNQNLAKENYDNIVLKIKNQLTEAINYLSDKGYIHYDIKTDNIMITPEGDVKLIDFGMARMSNYYRDEKNVDQKTLRNLFLTTF